jgi:hypothetical protein
MKYKSVKVLLLVLFCYVSLGVVNTKAEDDICRSTGSLNAYDKKTVQCFKAFCGLPEGDRRGTMLTGAFGSHILLNKDAYATFDSTCLSPLNKLKPFTQEFLKDTLGGLFFQSVTGSALECSAFRVAEDVIVTARHCIKSELADLITSYSFRLLSEPATEMKVTAEVSPRPPSLPGTVSDDFADFIVLRIDNKGVPYSKSRGDFRTIQRRDAWVVIPGFDSVAFVLGGENLADWPSSFRYADVAGSKWLSNTELPHAAPSSKASEHCIYYQAPSFGGMSGAPILGAERQPGDRGQPKVFIFGIHLRGGVTDQTGFGCGSMAGTNIGITLPAEAIKAAPD